MNRTLISVLVQYLLSHFQESVSTLRQIVVSIVNTEDVSLGGAQVQLHHQPVIRVMIGGSKTKRGKDVGLLDRHFSRGTDGCPCHAHPLAEKLY